MLSGRSSRIFFAGIVLRISFIKSAFLPSFIISSIGRVYAYSNFILVDTDKIKPVGDYLYYWNLDLNVTSLATAAAFYVLAA